MKPAIALDRTIVVDASDEVVHVLLELTAPPAPEVERLPLDVALVIDRSGSMSGKPIEAVTQAVARLIRQAGPDDRIGVVAFDNDVTTVLPLGRHVDQSAIDAVLAIGPGGSTNLSGGWFAGRPVEALSETNPSESRGSAAARRDPRRQRTGKHRPLRQHSGKVTTTAGSAAARSDLPQQRTKRGQRPVMVRKKAVASALSSNRAPTCSAVPRSGSMVGMRCSDS